MNGFAKKTRVSVQCLVSIHDPVLEHPAPSAPVSAPTPLPCSSITEDSTPEQKIALFRGLFRGREDVYAVRWEGKGGKAGYSPAGVMDWQAIHAARPEERKKVARKTRLLLSLTDDAIRNYLETIHARHLKIEQDQVVAILAVKRADLARIRRGSDGNITGTAQQSLEQKDTDLLIVDDKDFRVKNIR